MRATERLQDLRFPLRSAGFVGLTLGMYGLLEVDTALSDTRMRDVVLHTWMRRYGRALLELFGLEVRASGPFVGERARSVWDDQGFYPGRDARGVGRLFTMNHRSALDIAITLAFFEATIVSRADLAGWPVIGLAARRVGTLFVDRASKRSGAAVVHAMTTALQQGRGVMVYPEGTTFSGDEVRPFRAGGFTAACRIGAEVIPVGLAYAGDETSYIDEPFATHIARVTRAPRTVAAIEVGDPIETVGRDVGAVQNTARDAVQALVYRARARLTRAA